jgi:hypothetical protein
MASDVPQPDRVIVGARRQTVCDRRQIVAARRQGLAIRAERDVINDFSMAQGCAQLAMGAEVPQPHRSIFAARRQGLAVRAERDAIDEIGVAGEGGA